MSEDHQQFVSAFRRASIGLAVVAVGWVVAISLSDRSGESPLVWAIPVAAAILSFIFYSQARKDSNRSNTNR